MIPLSLLPTLNACLNATSATLLCLGYLCVRSKKIVAHKICMLSATLTSTAFLVSYIYYHFHAGRTHFPGIGWIRPVYFTMLLSHTVLAVVIVPLVLITLWHALRGDINRHRRIAHWTLPLWLYVSVTGVLIYRMLY